MADQAPTENILVATPAYGGMLHADFVQSILRLKHDGVNFTLATIGNESLITRARNSLLAYFHENTQFTHILYWDADVGFDTAALRAMLMAEKDVIGLPVALKGRNSQGDRIFNLGHLIGEDGPLWKVQHIGTAAFMLSRKAVAALVEDALDEGRVYRRSSNFNGQPGPEIQYDVFQVGVKDGQYLSEDYWVCHRLRGLGFDIFVVPEAPTTHNGVVSV
ncbi:MAG: hypothetical protein E6Q40_12915 [Cupriavidus sp.]|nr:MAG: hypothetical protein E6Q40_12915 [Cupriavidus sp.]